MASVFGGKYYDKYVEQAKRDICDEALALLHTYQNDPALHGSQEFAYFSYYVKDELYDYCYVFRDGYVFCNDFQKVDLSRSLLRMLR